MRLVLFLVLFSVSGLAHSACYLASGFRGSSALNGESYLPSIDGFGDRVFRIEIRGEEARITPNDLVCIPQSDSLIMCMGFEGEKPVTLETWSIDVAAGVVAYTQTRSGTSIPMLDGIKSLIGYIDGTCS